MNDFDQLIKFVATLRSLAGFNQEKALDAGVDPARVRAWKELHEVYYAPTHAAGKQRLAREAAIRQELSLDQLVALERRLKAIKHTRTRNKLRLEALSVRGRYKSFVEKLKAIIPPKPKDPPRDSIWVSSSRQGKRRMVISAPERFIADLEHFLRQKHEKGTSMAEHMLERFTAFVRGKLELDDGGGGGGGSAGAVPEAAPRPIIAIPLPDWVKIQQGQGDEVALTLTDGTTMTGAEYLNHYAATVENHLEAALFHPKEGAVNLYRTQRFANQKQRDLARMVNPGCPLPGCRHGADACEIHHITAWKHGGETNLDNLAPVCSYHNGTNDDDPGVHRRGRIVFMNGMPVWRSPRGYLVSNSVHPQGAMQSLFAR
ncbi:HNH endonuclease [Corynebacterium aquatimens]|uniref:HNH endonuclease signature motif containing protein n=1 Tax=Corynebacterium TaxID=1716 RepID=UPI001F2DC086|nr:MULTISPECIES: HNH endonuclease signature motif containing protein [Corynebacterium]QYH20156.1 HNH endonuclease [Corynebacterium aquatimens]UIZ92607.1 HNH endonuclease [Corynebacterium sp. CNCTC7651]